MPIRENRLAKGINSAYGLPCTFSTTCFQIVIPAFGTIEGLFQITSLEYRGDHAGEVTFDIALDSAGPLGFAAA